MSVLAIPEGFPDLHPCPLCAGRADLGHVPREYVYSDNDGHTKYAIAWSRMPAGHFILCSECGAAGPVVEDDRDECETLRRKLESEGVVLSDGYLNRRDYGASEIQARAKIRAADAWNSRPVPAAPVAEAGDGDVAASLAHLNIGYLYGIADALEHTDFNRAGDIRQCLLQVVKGLSASAPPSKPNAQGLTPPNSAQPTPLPARRRQKGRWRRRRRNARQLPKQCAMLGRTFQNAPRSLTPSWTATPPAPLARPSPLPMEATMGDRNDLIERLDYAASQWLENGEDESGELARDAADALLEAATTIASLSEALAEAEKKGAEAREEAARIALDFAKEPARAFTRKRMGLAWPVTAKPLALQAIRIAAAIRAAPPRDLSQGGQHG